MLDMSDEKGLSHMAEDLFMTISSMNVRIGYIRGCCRSFFSSVKYGVSPGQS